MPDPTAIEIRLLRPTDLALLENVREGVFDDKPDARWSAEFLADARHHLAVALEGGTVVGMASAVHYVHPDKAPELWVNEVGVAPSYRKSGLGKRLMKTLFDHGRRLGCSEAWVLTEGENVAARRLYESVGGQESSEPPVYYSFNLGS